MNSLFHAIADAQVVLRSKGVFYQKPLYQRDDRLYASWGTGFIRIGGQNFTSNPNVSYETLDLPRHVKIEKGSMGEPIISRNVIKLAEAA